MARRPHLRARLAELVPQRLRLHQPGFPFHELAAGDEGVREERHRLEGLGSVPALLGPDMVGIFHYSLHEPDGDEIESSAGGAPVVYLHGAGNILPALEEAGPGSTVVAPGISCRWQIGHLARRRALHPAQAALQSLLQTPQVKLHRLGPLPETEQRVRPGRVR